MCSNLWKCYSIGNKYTILNVISVVLLCGYYLALWISDITFRYLSNIFYVFTLQYLNIINVNFYFCETIDVNMEATRNYISVYKKISVPIAGLV